MVLPLNVLLRAREEVDQRVRALLPRPSHTSSADLWRSTRPGTRMNKYPDYKCTACDGCALGYGHKGSCVPCETLGGLSVSQLTKVLNAAGVLSKNSMERAIAIDGWCTEAGVELAASVENPHESSPAWCRPPRARP